jgi:signal transduction histidine kinase
MEDISFPTQNDKDFFSSLLDQEGNQGSTFKERDPSNGEDGFSLSVYYVELFNRVKASLAAMQAYAFLSLDNSKDKELAEHFYKIVNADIERTVSLLDCFNSYINFSTPLIKKNTVNTFIEEVIKRHVSQFQEKKVNIIKKQFEKDLPESILPDEQLKYILNSIVECVLLSIPLNGSIGFLTRSFDIETLTIEEKRELQKDGKYLEILVVSTSCEKSGEQIEFVPVNPAYPQQEEATGLILKLAKEIIKKNKGMMRQKVYEDKKMAFISLILPIERRNVVRYPSPEERLNKTKGLEK